MMDRRTLLRLAALPLAFAAGPAAAQSLPLGGAHYDNWYTVTMAAQRSRIDDVRRMLMSGSNPNDTDDTGRTALIYAATANNTAIAKLLIDYGAQLDYRDKFGNTALHWAAERGSLDVMRMLIAGKAPIDAVNKQGATPLMLAASTGKLAAAKLLIEAGADPKKQDFTGRDALGYAAGQPVVRSYLAERKG